jgi:hypothetical protein
MRLATLLMLAASVLSAADTVDAFHHRWTVQKASDWSVVAGELRLLVSAEPPPGVPRRPQKFAIAQTEPFRRVTVEAEIKRNGRSLIVVYAWQDDAHYDYAHISMDTAAKTNAHNGMFHVFGGERVRISSLDGPASLPDQAWTPIKLVFDGESGRCYVEVNGKRNPSLDAYDLSLRFGRVGLGSFDETGGFRNVHITGEPASK